MKEDLVLSLRYWYRATVSPRRAIVELKSHPRKLAIAFWINFVFALLYTITVVIYYAVIHRLPAFPPWVPAPVEDYYLYQAFWTIPWGLGTWIMMSGVCHLLSALGKENPDQYAFDNALLICGLGWVVPNLICMWIPETLLVPVGGVFWPEWVEMLRLTIIPPLWQTVIVAFGLRETYEVSWGKGIAIGLLSVLIFFIMFLAFMR
jgi:hypothetical protein